MGLESTEFMNLFIPGHSAIKNKLLTSNTSPAQVGDNIMAFLEDILEKRKSTNKANLINVINEK